MERHRIKALDKVEYRVLSIMIKLKKQELRTLEPTSIGTTQSGSAE